MRYRMVVEIKGIAKKYMVLSTSYRNVDARSVERQIMAG
jgi:hypothetical protein